MNSEKQSIFKNLNFDFPAGLVVYLVALPLCLGIGLASTNVSGMEGMPNLFSGIIAGVVGGIVVAAISGSPLGVSGPAAGLVVIVLAAIEKLGSFEAFLLAVVLAGIIQLVAGFLRAGIVAYYFPSSVIKGMLAAIGVILIMKEIPHAVGFDDDYMGDLDFSDGKGLNTFNTIYYSLLNPAAGATIISIFSMGLLILFERPFMKKFGLFKFLPGALFVVLAGIFINMGFGAFRPEWLIEGKHLVELPVATGISEFFSFFSTPDFGFLTNPDVYVVAITLAVVASLETLLCVEATDKLDPFKRITPTNLELKAQGIGNIASGLIGGLPITQVVVRSSANINSGGRTKMAAIIHGLILLLSAIFIPKFLNMIPLASLAAILLMVGYKLSKVSLYKEMYRLGWDQFLPFIVTIVAIILTDLLKGIGIGFAFAIYYIIRQNYRNSYHYKEEETESGRVITLRLSEEVTFLNKGSLLKVLSSLPRNCTVVIDGSRSVDIDYDVAEVIDNFKKHTAPLSNITVETKGF
jgi:MFS superfamily sulfate permease-like transporter